MRACVRCRARARGGSVARRSGSWASWCAAPSTTKCPPATARRRPGGNRRGGRVCGWACMRVTGVDVCGCRNRSFAHTNRTCTSHAAHARTHARAAAGKVPPSTSRSCEPSTASSTRRCARRPRTPSSHAASSPVRRQVLLAQKASYQLPGDAQAGALRGLRSACGRLSAHAPAARSLADHPDTGDAPARRRLAHGGVREGGRWRGAQRTLSRENTRYPHGAHDTGHWPCAPAWMRWPTVPNLCAWAT